MALNGFKGDIKVIDWRMALMRKYVLAYLLNWMARDRGRNVSRVYFVVIVEFDG